MRQPWPAIFGPPMIAVERHEHVAGRAIGPFWNGTLSGKCRRPIVTPGVLRGISAQVMP